LCKKVECEPTDRIGWGKEDRLTMGFHGATVEHMFNLIVLM